MSGFDTATELSQTLADLALPPGLESGYPLALPLIGGSWDGQYMLLDATRPTVKLPARIDPRKFFGVWNLTFLAPAEEPDEVYERVFVTLANEVMLVLGYRHTSISLLQAFAKLSHGYAPGEGTPDPRC